MQGSSRAMLATARPFCWNQTPCSESAKQFLFLRDVLSTVIIVITIIIWTVQSLPASAAAATLQ